MALASALGVLFAAAMIALNLLSVAAVTQPAAASAPSPAQPPSQSQPASGSPLDLRVKGSPNAPVVITEWFDFQCPGCGNFARTREPEIDRLYVDTGKIRFVSRNFQFLGPESILAAEAAQCAADQGRYWEYRTLLFQRQRGENLGAFHPGNLKRFAAELGLDQSRFDACFDLRVYRELVQAELKEGDALGVKATPSFSINGRLIEGVPTVDRLGKLIEEELEMKS